MFKHETLPTKRGGLTAAFRLQRRSLLVRAETSPPSGGKGGRLRASRRTPDLGPVGCEHDHVFALSSLVLHESRWRDFITQIIAFRKWVRANHGLPIRTEIHASEYMRHPPYPGLSRPTRLQILQDFMDELISTLPVKLCGMAGSRTRSREMSEKSSEGSLSHSAVASAFWDCRGRNHSSRHPALRRPSIMWAWSSGRTPGKRPRISLSTCSGAIAIAFSSASFASAVRPSWPSAAASTR